MTPAVGIFSITLSSIKRPLISFGPITGFFLLSFMIACFFFLGFIVDLDGINVVIWWGLRVPFWYVNLNHWLIVRSIVVVAQVHFFKLFLKCWFGDVWWKIIVFFCGIWCCMVGFIFSDVPCYGIWFECFISSRC